MTRVSRLNTVRKGSEVCGVSRVNRMSSLSRVRRVNGGYKVVECVESVD